MRSVFITVLLLKLAIICNAQTKSIFSGFVKDSASNENLIGAHIIVFSNGNSIFSVTDKQGYFQVVATNPDSIAISYIGYKTLSSTTNLIRNTEYLLSQDIEQLETVAVRAPIYKEESFSRISAQEIIANPTIASIPDVMKVAQTLPGLTTQNEGSSRLIVRGGLPGQNQYRIDEIPLIYVNHLGGFFSIFNPDVINVLDIYKDGFPVYYGGRLSSYVSITQKDGNNKSHKSKLTLSPLVSSYYAEGPLKTDKLTYVLSLRKTFIDAFMAAGTSLSNGNSFTLAYGFHDINTKLTYKPNEKNQYALIFYQGDDYINYWSGSKNNNTEARRQNIWGNWMTALKWKRLYSERLISEFDLSYTRYRLKYKNIFYDFDQSKNPLINNRYNSNIAELGFQNRYELFINNSLSIQAGVEAYQKYYVPNEIVSVNHETVTATVSQLDPYLQLKMSFSNLIKIDLGARLNNYFNDSYIKSDISPRGAIFIQPNKHHQINFSYDRLYQYSHMLFTNGYIASNEIWLPANQDYGRSDVSQYSLGYRAQNIIKNLSSSVSLYYKDMNDMVTTQDGVGNLLGDPNWQTKLVSNVNSNSRGLELLLDYNHKDYSAKLAYTLSQTRYQSDQLNEGEAYTYEFDRPHVIDLFVSKSINTRLDLSVAWTFQSGLPFTPAIGKRVIPSIENEYTEVLIIGERNSDRLKAYHRLDLGLTYKKTSKKGRPVEWRFSVYNAYNRLNAYANFYHYTDSEELLYDLDFEGKKINLYQRTFFPIIPSFSYTIYFDKRKG